MKARTKAVAGVVVGVTAIGGVVAGVVQASHEGGVPTGYTTQPIGGEQNIALDQVPPQVLHTADQAAQGADLTKAQVDFDEVEAVYELTAADIEVDVKADGTLQEIEEKIVRRQVPREVRRLLRHSFPDLRIDQIERSTRPTPVGLLQRFYEFDGENRGEEIDLIINERGTVFTVEPLELQRPAPGTEVLGDPEPQDG